MLKLPVVPCALVSRHFVILKFHDIWNAAELRSPE
jgi:hypothetical protein